MTAEELRQTFAAIHEVLSGLRNAVRPTGQTWQWDEYFSSRLAIIEQASQPSAREEKTKSNARTK